MKKRSWLHITIYTLIILSSFLVGKNVEDSLIKNLSIVSAVGIDLEEDLYAVTLQVINPKRLQKDAGQTLGYINYKESGRTITEAMKKINTVISRNIFLDDTEIFIVSEELARSKGINEVIDYLIIEPNVASNISFFVTKGDAANAILNIFTPVQQVSAQRIHEMLTNIQKEAGFATRIYPNRVKNYLLNYPVVNNIVPYITIEGNFKQGFKKENIETFDPETKIKIEGMAFFHRDKIVDFLNLEESKTLLLVTNHLRMTFLESNCPDGNGFVAMRLDSSKTKINHKLENGIPRFKVDVTVAGRIQESSCEIGFKHPDLQRFETHFGNLIEAHISDLIKLSQSHHVDFIGFGKAMYLSKPSDWRKIEKTWEDIYPNVEVDVKVKVDISESGDATKLK
ncbi:Ger(x)C family spore germination protein [Anaerobacillus alkaliphilus]|uniref:Ger(X)C family spore germination protein n=1 Tax=Anaerobacillus alkaliphilus TaxID=1548597 RepID=A0A4Q0VXM7_9BACI|nr:Ger(x)C family spore germination protein [Anaerobacillus alkaliphilus]RXJ04152.1 Ger(x)C family spore germination protein [Anaerobacillus alkaliphilus]